jgi:hypothetical protein
MRLRFSIRDLLWLVALVAVLVAWRIDRNDVANQRDALGEILKKAFSDAVPDQK